MENIHAFDERQKKLLNALGVYVHTNISKYIDAHWHGSMIHFINAFILCPEPDEFDQLFYRPAIDAKLHFEEGVSSSLVEISLHSVQLISEHSSEFFLSIQPLHLSANYDPFFAELKDSSISSPNKSFDEFFSDLSANDKEQMIKNFANTD